MNAHIRTRLLLVPALLALLAANSHALADTVKGKTNLVRPDPFFGVNAVVPDADAKGTLSIDTKTSTGRDRFEVIVKRINKAQTYTLFVSDPEDPGEFNAPGIPLTGTGTTKKLKLDTDKGDTLPYGVTDVSELVGVEVRVVVGSDPEDPATLYLKGVVPALGASKETLRAKLDLALAVNSPDDNAEGRFESSSKASNGDERLNVKVKAIDFDSHTFSLWIEDANDPGSFLKAGDFTRKNKNTGFFDVRTKEGAPLPLGALSATEFAGREVQVRDQTDIDPVADHPYLSALIPQFN